MERQIRVFSSFEEENEAERARRAAMTPAERFAEFAVLQERLWGLRWTSTPIVRQVSWERVPWWEG